MRILLWHVHGGYTDALVRGDHEYLLPVDGLRSAWGRGRAGRDWPHAVEVDTGALRETEFDVVVLQRPEELDRVAAWTGRVPGRDVAALYLEHNTPKPDAVATRHPLAERDDIPIVHVTHFNRVFWDNGSAPTRVIEHGVPDPGYRYTGELARIGVVVNEPVRRRRVAGIDLLPGLAAGPVDVFGMGGERIADAWPGAAPDVTWAGDLPTGRLHAELARRRVYVHPYRWTSLGLSLLEAMHLGLPVVALAATDAARAVPPDAGTVSTNPDELRHAVAELLADPELAESKGRAARAYALDHYGLPGFLDRWDAALTEAVAEFGPRSRAGVGRRT